MYRLQSVSKLIKVGSFHTVDTVKEELLHVSHESWYWFGRDWGNKEICLGAATLQVLKVTPFSFLFRLTHPAFVCLCPTRALGQCRGFQFQVLPVNGLPPNTTFDNFIDKK